MWWRRASHVVSHRIDRQKDGHRVFEKLSEEEFEDDNIPASPSLLRHVDWLRRGRPFLYFITVLNLLWSVVNLLLTVSSGPASDWVFSRLPIDPHIHKSIGDSNTEGYTHCLEHVLGYSPIHQAINVQKTTNYLNGTLFPPQHPSPSRLEPGDAASEAWWDAFEPIAYFPISRADIELLGKDPSSAAKFPADMTFPSRSSPSHEEADDTQAGERYVNHGDSREHNRNHTNHASHTGHETKTSDRVDDEKFVAALDVTHKIHCLNELRKAAFATYPFPSEEQRYNIFPRPNRSSSPSPSPSSSSSSSSSSTDTPDSNIPAKDSPQSLRWIHLRHCVDLLFQDLSCSASADIVTYNYRDTQIYPYPDFSVRRQCRDLNQLIEYAESRKVDMDEFMDKMRFQPGVTDKSTLLLPNEKGYYDRYGYEWSAVFPDGEGAEEYWAEQGY